MDECNKTPRDCEKNAEDDLMEIRRRLRCFSDDPEELKEWVEYSGAAPGVDEFNDPGYGKEPIKDVEPEIFTMQELTPESKEKILQEFAHAAQIAKVKPLEGHPCIEEGYGDNPRCPILSNPDEIMVKIKEVFHPEQVAMEEEDGSSDKHFILSYIQAKMPKRTVGWKDGALYVDGARTNVTYQSIATLIAKKLRRVF